jgi:hypothetical protein
VIWLSWRQQRTEAVLSAAMVVLLAALFIPAGLHLASFYDHHDVARCIAGQKTLACGQTLAAFGNRAGILRSVIPWLTLLPGMVGVALAAPIVLDLEGGTYRLAWTQSITRGRWIAIRFSLAVGTALAAAGLLAVLFTWYRTPLDHVYGRFDGTSFDLEGTVSLGYALFPLGLGLAVGVVWRRTAPAVIASFLAYVACRLFVDGWLRQRFVTPLSATWSIKSRGPNLNSDWVLSSGMSDRAGHLFGGNFAALQACGRVAFKGAKELNANCLARHGAGYNHAVWQPNSRFWEFQGIETTLFAGLGLLLIAFAAWRVLASD